MKLALLIGLDAEKRSGFPLTPVAVPFDEALRAFKGMVAAGVAPAPHVQLWSSNGLVKQARFKKVQAPKAAKGSKTELLKRISELEARVVELEAQTPTGAAQTPPLTSLEKEPEPSLEDPAPDSPLVPKT
ncbi:MAG TPA: hypothetical protein DIT13_04730 [Verrucomicrobiales bacterium]|nr:hypothetical protein [Verrucomicrobiales bacterium]HRJ09363.1 hypothetical protein [Prosthecobacter sp.]HRK15053.1 hypothetical protein [Prosthecobacter sp.]